MRIVRLGENRSRFGRAEYATPLRVAVALAAITFSAASVGCGETASPAPAAEKPLTGAVPAAVATPPPAGQAAPVEPAAPTRPAAVRQVRAFYREVDAGSLH